ncbi:MAG: carbohydrate ABC transporter permease [Bacilli bacterium]
MNDTTIKPLVYKKHRDILSVNKRTDIILLMIIALITLICIFPYLLSISISFSDPDEVLKNGVKLIPTKISLASYEYLGSFKGQLINSLKVSLFVTIVGTTISSALTITMGYVISRKDFPFAKPFTFFVFFTMLFNAGMVPNYMIITQVLGLKNNIWALIVPLLINPFWILVAKTFFTMSIPFEIIEAAKIDGASEFKLFTRIVLPLSLPIIATIALFSSIAYWNDWFSSMLYIDDSRLVSLQYMMQKIQKSFDFLLTNADTMPAELVARLTKIPMESLMMSVMILATLPIVVAYPFFQRYFISGLTIGAVK